MTAEELIGKLQRGAAQGIHPRHVLLALGFRAARTADGRHDLDEPVG